MRHRQRSSTRRQFLHDTGRFAAASALAGVALPAVHGHGNETIKLALIGCGGRGGGAIANALSVPDAKVELVAVADVFAGKPDKLVDALQQRFGGKVDVPPERRFVGFDGYQRAMDCLRPGDIAILATPPAFRWVHYRHAIDKQLHGFLEKPLTVDGPTSKRMLQLNERALAAKLKVGVGLMSRHNHGMRELQQRIANGEIGELLLLRGYRMHGPAAFFRSLRKPDDISDLMYQIQRFHSFLWASGGNFSDFNIHIIDHLCWMKDAWPQKAQGVGGRHYREGPDGVYVDQNFDSYAVEYTFADGARLVFDGRCMPNCAEIYSSYAHGTKGSAIVSSGGDCGLPSSIYRGQTMAADDLLWRSQVPANAQDPYQNEWNALLAAIRDDVPYNEVERGVRTSLVTSMGRMAAHTGREITFEQMLGCEHEFAPGVDRLSADSPAPLLADAAGRYPVPMPGQKVREY